MFEALVFVTAVLAGGIAAVTGFGIGSLLTPLLALQIDTRLAVAAVSVPHVVATALRFWLLQGSLDRRVFWTFGIMSAAGGLTGALLQGSAGNRVLSAIFGGLLLFVAASEALGFMRGVRFHGAIAWIAGALSGLLGGLVGNQGGIRAGGLLGFDLPKERFIATATAVGLVVDGVRMPVYIAAQGREMADLWPWLALASAGVSVGTLAGHRVLRRIPEAWFHRFLSLVLASLGVAMLTRAL